MKKNKSSLQTLATIKINKKVYKITATMHGIKRMNERKVYEYLVSSSILALGEKRLSELQKTKEEIIIIDKENKISTIIAFLENSIRVITVIDKSKVFVKTGTKIVNL